MERTRETISLAGEWRFELDRENKGIAENWFAKELPEAISLPGTTDEAEKGDLVDERCDDRLSRIWRWIGPAWYQRTVTVPESWSQKRITLFLERTKDSQVWVDDRWVGSDDSLSTPHEFDLSGLLTPGEHALTILVDNAKLPPVGPCHQVDERTQTNWNGILGRIELTATDKVWIDDVRAYPDPEKRSVRVVAGIRIATDRHETVNVRIGADVVGREGEFAIEPASRSVRSFTPLAEAECVLDLPDDVPLWDEFDRSMLRVTVEIEVASGDEVMRDSESILFGMREFRAERGRFVVNGRDAFLRGKNDCALFPLTGYAPMEKAEWLRLLGIAAEYGINHYRFHSWCPPEAAFAAADELGIYFQVELPNKRGITAPDNRDYSPPAEAYETLDELKGDAGDPAVRTAYLTREGEKILKAFGNHPSFAMMTLGNELGGDIEIMKGMCDRFRELDDRHLYAIGTGAFHWDIGLRPGNDFWVTRATAPGREVRGASWGKGFIDDEPPSTTVDYASALEGVPVPVVGHEMAQYEVYPDYREIKKYTGVLRARNLEIFRERLKEAGMLDQARDFLNASGALSLICHREDIEAALRTPGFGGFQMLDPQDFSGQGTALVGMLNVFMESKGLVKPARWREFCCETVPLLWMTKYTWTNDETFRGRIRVAHYGPTDLEDKTVAWKIADGNKKVAEGETRRMTIPTGTVTDVDLFCADLGNIKTARKLSVSLALKGTKYRTSYDIWVYPSKLKSVPAKGVVTSRTFGDKECAALKAGKRVLLMPEPGTVKRTVATAFQGSFWSPMFRKPGKLNPLGKETPGVQGILLDPEHPLFRDFPTEFHSNWQWWQLVKNCSPMVLDDTPRGYRPLVQMIDGFDRNHKLGLICEAKIGKGRLLICSIDLPGLQQHPEARQLLASLQRYVGGRDFKPDHELSGEVIAGIV